MRNMTTKPLTWKSAAAAYLRREVFTWPNVATTVRLACALVMYGLPNYAVLVAWLAFAGAISDAMDGILAKWLGGTKYGERYDQWVDWFFGFALIYTIAHAENFVWQQWPFNGELFSLISGYLLARLRFPMLSTIRNAKIKTAMQFTGAVSILGGHAHVLDAFLTTTMADSAQRLIDGGYALIWLSVVLMLLSLFDYGKLHRQQRRR